MHVSLLPSEIRFYFYALQRSNASLIYILKIHKRGKFFSLTDTLKISDFKTIFPSTDGEIFILTHRYLREDVLARTSWREVAAEAQDPRGATLEDSAVSTDAEIRALRHPTGQALAGDAVGEEAGLREQPGAGWRRSGSRSAAAEGIHLRLVSALPDPHPRHEQRGLAMMAKGKMGPRGRRARPQIEPFAQRRGRVRRQDHLLMEIVADHVAMSAGSNPRRNNGVSYYYKFLYMATRLTLFQKANEVRIDEVSVFLCCCDFSIITYIRNSVRIVFR